MAYSEIYATSQSDGWDSGEYDWADDVPEVSPWDPDTRVVGMCTACGSVEVHLNHATGTRNFSDIGESANYPTGYGCEVCD